MKRPAATQKSHLLKRRAILVLGMHRSGTSALSGVACSLGASAPNNLLPANFANPHGYWESLPLVQAHTELLASADSSWDDWRQLDPRWYGSEDARRFHGRIRDVLEGEYDEKPLFVVKDPRLCRLVPFFLSVLKEMAVTPIVLFSLRDPLEVAFSLRRRDGFPISKSVALWLRHVLEAEFHSRKIPRCIISYENLLKDWRLEMSRAGGATGVAWPADPETSTTSIEKFLAADLYHERNESAGLEKHPELLFLAAEAYRLLLAASTAPADRNLFRQIDAVRAKFDAASEFFGAILRTEQASVQQLRTKLLQKSSELEQQRALAVDQTHRQQAIMEEQTKLRRALTEQQRKLEQALMDEQTKLQQALIEEQTKLQRALIEKQNKHEKAFMEEQAKRQQALIEQQQKHEQASMEQQKRHRSELDRQIHHNETERSEYVARVDSLNSQLEQLHDASTKNESRLNQVIAELSAALDRKTSEHANLVADFELSKSALDDARANLAANHDLSERLASELKRIGARHEELQADILCKNANIDDLNREIAAHRKHAGNLQTLLVDRNEQNQEMMIRIEALYASRSWRMTGPLRAARRFFSKVTSPSRSVG
jgi:hypothetical protein